VYEIDDASVWGKNSSLFYALEAVNVFVNRAIHLGAGALLVENRPASSNADVLWNDCDCARLRCCVVPSFVIWAEMHGEATMSQDYDVR